MFFNKKEAERPPPRSTPRRRDRALSPRFARLVRESWWLLVVAAFVWLALILATYSKTDPGLVVLGHRRADRQQGRRRRRVARRSAALPVRTVRLVVGRRRRRAGRRRLPPHRPTRNSRPIIRCRSACSASRWCCSRAPRSRRCASTACRRRCRIAPGGAIGDVDRPRALALLGFNGATLLAARAVRRRLLAASSACRGCS